MTKRLQALLSSVFISALSFAQPALSWDQHYNGPPDQGDEAVSIAVDASGNSYVTGSAFASNGTLDIVTIKYSPTGQQLWLQSYNGSANDNDQGRKIVLDAAANVYVTGYSKSANGNDITTIKYNTSGAQQWVAVYDGAFHGYDEGNSVAVDANGNVFVTGFETSANQFFQDMVTIMYNSGGTQQWANIYDGAGAANDYGVDIVNDGAGNTYAVGTSDTMYNSAPNNDIVLLKFNNSGTMVWRAVYGSPTYSYDIARRMCLDHAGNILICGYGGLVNQGNNYYTLKYNPSGSGLWVQFYNYSTNTYEQPWDIIADSLDNVIVTGQGVTSSSSPTNDYVTVKYNSAGVFQWASRYDGPAANNDYAYGVALDDSMNIYVTGTSKGLTGTQYDVATVKYNPAGNQQYVLRYDNIAAHKDDAGNDIAIHNGDIYVTGRSSNLTNDDYVTLLYSYSSIGIQEQNDAVKSLNVFPNPSTDEIHLALNAENLSSATYCYRVENAFGQEVKQGTAGISESTGSVNSVNIGISDLRSGLYFITLYQDENPVGKARFIVR
jgi:uncharacterized delta-60 repeat protein